MDQGQHEVMTRRMTTAEATVETLARNGVRTVFCLPGVQNDHLFDALHAAQDRIRPIHTRHEQGAAYMALGAALATGEPFPYSVVPGPGFLNTTAALSTAWACYAPVLCLTGQIPSAMIGRGYGQLHEIPDQLRTMRTLTKWAERIRAPQEGASLATEAFRQVRSGPARPVGLECAIDVWGRRAAVRLEPPAEAALPPVDTDAVEQAARLLGAAERPLVVVGSGALHAGAEVAALSERLQAPVVSHRLARGLLDSRNPFSLSILAGHRAWAGADVVLGVGTRMQQHLMQWGTDDALKVIRIDLDPEEMDRIRAPQLGIVGDSAAVLRALLEALPRHDQRRRGPRTEELLALRAEVDALLAPMQPQLSFLQAIRAELPDEGIFVDELTQLGYVGRVAFPVYRPRTYLSSGYQGTLGWGVATALGAKAARPDVPVVSINGDGGFMFNVQELATAVQHRIPAVFVLVNDGAYGNVRRIQVQSFGNRTIATDLRNPDFRKLTESFGALYRRAATPDELRPALREAFQADGGGLPTVIEVPAGTMPDPWKLLRLGRVRGK